MKNTLHTSINHPLTYDKGVNGDVSPNAKYMVEGTAYRLINCRINPLTMLIEGIEGADMANPITVVRDGVKPVLLSPSMVKSTQLGKYQVIALGGTLDSQAQLAVYMDGVLKVIAQHPDLGIKAGYRVDMASDGTNEIYVGGPQTPSLFLSLKDMLDNIGKETYFSEFDLISTSSG